MRPGLDLFAMAGLLGMVNTLLLGQFRTSVPSVCHADPYRLAFRVARKLGHEFAIGRMPHEVLGRGHSQPPGASLSRLPDIHDKYRNPAVVPVPNGSTRPMDAGPLLTRKSRLIHAEAAAFGAASDLFAPMVSQ
jgi:hypothetical protein